ncbi:hypothetical protein Tco_0863792 [Tanacetum coccineum]
MSFIVSRKCKESVNVDKTKNESNKRSFDDLIKNVEYTVIGSPLFGDGQVKEMASLFYLKKALCKEVITVNLDMKGDERNERDDNSLLTLKMVEAFIVNIHLAGYPTQYRLEEKKEQQQSYIDLKNRELDIHEKASREAAELKRQELEIKRKTLELKLRNKRDKDLRFYMKKIDETLPPIQQEKLKEMKQEIKELYDLNF